MPLRGIKPEKIKKRLKMLIYGKTGVGKTIASIQFPNPYLIDAENGAENDQYRDLLSERKGVIFRMADIDEIIQEITTLISEKHSYKTLIIDPLTVVYDNLLDIEATRPMKDGKDPTSFGRHYIAANRKIKHFLNLLLRLDMNVVITSHQKVIYNDKLQVVGSTFDCYKKLDYLFDLVLEVQKRGEERVGIVKKSRISSFKEGDNFNFSYKEIAKRYGIEILEKSTEIKKLATKENIKELEELIEVLKVPEEVIKKWLSKTKSESLEEMEQKNIELCIQSLREKIPCTAEPKSISK